MDINQAAQNDRLDALGDLMEWDRQRREAEAGTVEAIDRARRAGTSWADIGLALNMSKQGAQQRYGRTIR
jgi:hypothetical protein